MSKKAEFEQWMKQVDRYIMHYCGLTHEDLADQRWYDMFADEYTARDAAEEALESEGFPF